MDRNTQLTAANGKNVDAITVFSLSMKYLKDEAVKTIREATKDDFYKAEDFQWVLTVPAIWTAAAKQFMREAAYQVTGITLFPCFFFLLFYLLRSLLREYLYQGI